MPAWPSFCNRGLGGGWQAPESRVGIKPKTQNPMVLPQMACGDREGEPTVSSHGNTGLYRLYHGDDPSSGTALWQTATGKSVNSDPSPRPQASAVIERSSDLAVEHLTISSFGHLELVVRLETTFAGRTMATSFLTRKAQAIPVKPPILITKVDAPNLRQQEKKKNIRYSSRVRWSS
jgi:hypothetical protein